MKFIQQIERLQKLNKLICQQNTGSPDELANKLNLKRTQLYEVMEQLRDQGAPIKYSRRLHTFYYSYEFNFEISLQVKVLTGNEVKNVYGGGMINFIKKILPFEETERSKFNLAIAPIAIRGR